MQCSFHIFSPFYALQGHTKMSKKNSAHVFLSLNAPRLHCTIFNSLFGDVMIQHALLFHPKNETLATLTDEY
jgi:hypothetical protein